MNTPSDLTEETPFIVSLLIEGLDGGYLNNTKHLNICFDNIKQLNFRLFNI